MQSKHDEKQGNSEVSELSESAVLRMALLRSDIINKEFVERVLRKKEVRVQGVFCWTMFLAA